MKWVFGCVAIAVLALGCGGTKSNEVKPTPEPAAVEAAAPEDSAKPGVKPHFVPCDPKRPDLPCTPTTPPLDIEGKGETKTPPGVKPHYVKCDPNRPEMPCTPDTPPIYMETK